MREQKWKISEQKYVRSSKRMFWHLFQGRFWYWWGTDMCSNHRMTIRYSLIHLTCESHTASCSCSAELIWTSFEWTSTVHYCSEIGMRGRQKIQYMSRDSREIVSDVNQTVEIITYFDQNWPLKVSDLILSDSLKTIKDLLIMSQFWSKWPILGGSVLILGRI